MGGGVSLVPTSSDRLPSEVGNITKRSHRFQAQLPNSGLRSKRAAAIYRYLHQHDPYPSMVRYG